VLGAAAFWDTSTTPPDVVSSWLSRCLDAGVNHLDVAPSYGAAQSLLGPLLPAVRSRLFVGCKTLRSKPDGMRAQLEDSLRVLGCTSFDLYQLHAVTNLEELDRRASAGAVDALLRFRDEGLCRFVGITGHGLGTCRAQLEALRRYDLDTVMFPVSPRLWGDAGYRDSALALLDECASRDVGVMAIKAASARPKPADSDATTWYEPYWDASEVERGVRFALSVPGVSAICTPGDVRVLDLALSAAASFAALSPSESAAAVDAVRDEEPIFPMPTPG
jgi:predicted aldo/keto reductase-like oxidoreductase